MNRSTRQRILRLIKRGRPLAVAAVVTLLAVSWAATGARVGLRTPDLDLTVSAWWLVPLAAALATALALRLGRARYPGASVGLHDPPALLGPGGYARWHDRRETEDALGLRRKRR